MGSGWEETPKNLAALHHAQLCFKTVALHFQRGKCCIREVFRAAKHRRTSTGMVLDRVLESDFQIVKTPFPQWGVQWSGWRDSNPRPPAPETGALPS